GNIYLTGYTNGSGFPTTVGAYDRTQNGNYDVYVTKLTSAGALSYSTFVGGLDADYSLGIAIDGSGQSYVTGYTSSSAYPPTVGAYDQTPNGGIDVFVTKLNAAGSQLSYSTRLGGGGDDYSSAIAVDGSGRSYVIGYTDSITYPTSIGAQDSSYNGGVDVFVT